MRCASASPARQVRCTSSTHRTSFKQELDVPEPLPPSAYRLVEPGADANMIAKAAELIKAAKNPILLVGHAVQCTRGGEKVKALQEVMQCPVIQTSGGTAFIKGLEDRTFPYLFSSVGNEIVKQSDLVIAIGTELGEPMHYGSGHHWKAGDAKRKWIYVELDPSAIGQNRRVRRAAGRRPAHRSCRSSLQR